MTASAWARVATLFDHEGINDHYGESVRLGEHMLQAAALANRDGAEPALIVAALLHDVGHLTDPATDDDDRNRRHDVRGHALLADVFPPSVVEPIRLHITAKRHLVATDPTYHRRLSPASVHTLRLQGGPLGDAEQLAFATSPHAGAALRVRAWDDAAKTPGLDVSPLDHYRSMIVRLPPC